MNCIDAVEGTVKTIITEFHRVFLERRMDDTEYIENIKTLIAGTDVFVKEHPEITYDPELLKQILYAFAKQLWLQSLLEADLSAPEAKQRKTEPVDQNYQEYYYDHIYQQGTYPQ